MSSAENRSRALVVPIILFVLTLLPALGLLLASFTLWLSQLVGSAILSCVIVGVALLLISLIIYFALLRGVIKRMQDRLDVIYETSRIVHSGLDWINSKLGGLWS